MNAFVLVWILATDFGQSRISVGSQRYESKKACEKGGQIMEKYVAGLNSDLPAVLASLAWKCTPAE